MEFIENFVSFARRCNKRTVLNILDIVACYTCHVFGSFKSAINFISIGYIGRITLRLDLFSSLTLDEWLCKFENI